MQLRAAACHAIATEGPPGSPRRAGTANWFVPTAPHGSDSHPLPLTNPCSSTQPQAEQGSLSQTCYQGHRHKQDL